MAYSLSRPIVTIHAHERVRNAASEYRDRPVANDASHLFGYPGGDCLFDPADRFAPPVVNDIFSIEASERQAFLRHSRTDTLPALIGENAAPFLVQSINRERSQSRISS